MSAVRNSAMAGAGVLAVARSSAGDALQGTNAPR
jgi:hypothetical protein